MSIMNYEVRLFVCVFTLMALCIGTLIYTDVNLPGRIHDLPESEQRVIPALKKLGVEASTAPFR